MRRGFRSELPRYINETRRPAIQSMCGLDLVQFCILAVIVDKLMVRAGFGDTTHLDRVDNVSVLDGGGAMAMIP